MLRTIAPMKPNTLAAFYDALAPGPESAVGVLPPPDMGQGVGHFNVFSLADLRGTPPMTFSPAGLPQNHALPRAQPGGVCRPGPARRRQYLVSGDAARALPVAAAHRSALRTYQILY